MQMEQLEYIVVISTNHSISKSAKILHISQSALSQSIAKLENELGLRIFIRSRMGTIPTKEGKKIIALAEDALDKINNIMETAKEHDRQQEQKIKLGVVSGLYLQSLPMVMSQLQSEINLTVNLVEEKSTKIIQDIHEKLIDIGILAVYEDTLKISPNIHLEKLYDEKMYVFVNSKSPLTSYRTLEPLQLINEPFILYNGEFMNWYFDQLTEKHGKIKVLFSSNNVEVIRDSVKRGMGITIETQTELSNNPYIQTQEIVAIPLRMEGPEFYVGIAIHKDHVKSKRIKRFRELLKAKLNVQDSLY